MRKLAAVLLPLMVIGGFMVACDDDDDAAQSTNTPDAGAAETSTAVDSGTPDTSTDSVDAGTDADAGQTATRGTLVTTVTYTGTKTGSLNVAYFTAPTSPPVDGVRTAAATFPSIHTFEEVVPGDYIAFAYLDVGDNNPTNPGDEDVQAADFVPFTIVAGESATITIPLDPPAR